MDLECQAMGEDDLKRVLYSLDFRFRGKFFDLFDRYITVKPDGTVNIMDEHGFAILRDLLSAPLGRLHERYIEVSVNGNGTIGNANHVLRLLGLAPSLHGGLVLEAGVPAASIVAEMSRDAEDGFKAGINPAKVVYLMKLMEQMALLSDRADVLDSGICENWALKRGIIAIHELSEAVTPSSNRSKFREYPVLSRVVALYTLNHLWNVLDGNNEMLKGLVRDGLIEGMGHCNEGNYGSSELGTHLGLMTKKNLAMEPGNLGAIVIQDASPMPFSPARCDCGSTALVRFRDGLPSKRLSSERPEVWASIASLLTPGGRVSPHIWFNGLASAHYPDIIGEEKPRVLVPKLSDGGFHRRALEFLARVEGHPEAVAVILSAINHLVLPHMDRDVSKIPPTIRTNLTTVYSCLESSCDRCGLPGREIATALLFSDNLEPILIGRENLPVVAYMLFSAQIQQASLVGDCREWEGNGNGESNGSPLRRLSESVVEYIWRTRTLNGNNSTEARLKRYSDAIGEIHSSIPPKIREAMDMAGLPDGMATVASFSRVLALKAGEARRLQGNRPLMLQSK